MSGTSTRAPAHTLFRLTDRSITSLCWGAGSDEIEYKFDVPLETDDIVELYAAAGLERPIQDKARIRKMFDNSNLVVSAWRGKQLVGVSRALTDFAFVCYLSDLAVRRDLQKGGIGKKLIALTHEKAGVEVRALPMSDSASDRLLLLLLLQENRLLLLSAPSAMEYYPVSQPRVGFL